MTSTTERTMPAIGERRMSFTMTPNHPDGRPINGGMAYANAHTLGDARAYADRVFHSGVMGHTVGSVDISGQVYEFTDGGWAPVRGLDYVSERVTPVTTGETP